MASEEEYFFSRAAPLSSASALRRSLASASESMRLARMNSQRSIMTPIDRTDSATRSQSTHSAPRRVKFLNCSVRLMT